MLDTGHAFRRREPGASKGRASLVACSQNKWCLLLTPMAPQIGSKLTSELIWQPAYKPSAEGPGVDVSNMRAKTYQEHGESKLVAMSGSRINATASERAI